jgi:dihydrofolate reductase
VCRKQIRGGLCFAPSMSSGPPGRLRGMATVISHMSMSLDGYVAGPAQSQEHPIGVGGLALHQWHFDPVDQADVPWRDQLLNRGDAYIMGRNMFGPVRGPWQALGSGALDELVVDIIPVVLGRGESMFGDITNLVLIPIEVAHSPHATHIRYQVGPAPAGRG